MGHGQRSHGSRSKVNFKCQRSRSPDQKYEVSFDRHIGNVQGQRSLIIGMDFNAKRLCLFSEIFSETAIAHMHAISIKMSQSCNNLMRQSPPFLHFSKTFEIWMSHSLHVSPLPKHCKVTWVKVKWVNSSLRAHHICPCVHVNVKLPYSVLDRLIRLMGLITF